MRKLAITERSSFGEILVRYHVNNFAKPSGLYMYCSRCTDRWQFGLGGDPAATPEDLCIGAMVEGWKLFSTIQLCPKCKRRPICIFFALVDAWIEWWARLWPWNKGRFLCALLVQCMSIVLFNLVVFNLVIPGLRWFFK